MTRQQSPHILTVKKLSKRFGKAEVLTNVKLSLGFGEIYAIIGPNGAGKTTLFNLITGVIKKDQGEVFYFKDGNGGMVSRKDYNNDPNETIKIDITGWKAHKVARLGIGRTFQGNRVFSNMTTVENVMVAKQLVEIENPISILNSTQRKLMEKIKNRNGIPTSDKEVKKLEDILRKEAEYWLEFVGLKEKIENKAEELSYGQQKLLSIARLLMADSSLLLFDEPTAGVNPKYSARIAEIFKKIVENVDKTILFIEHDMKFIQELGCKCLYLENGKCPWPFFELEVIMKNPDIRRKFMGM